MPLSSFRRTTLFASIALAATTGSVSAAQPPAQAFDQYVGQFGAKNVKPPFVTGTIGSKHYAAGTCPTTAWCEAGDDLLTAGLGATGLLAAAPAFVDPLAPTAAELRRNAIHTNYRAVLDILPAGGYGTLYGPNVTNRGVITAGDGRIPGWEYVAYADDGSGRKNVTLMVQIPDGFDARTPCIVTATSSGSRGVYGAIGASGEWGLKQGCAVAYTDKGTGNGLHDLMTNSVGLIDGTRTDADTAGDASIFSADVTDDERAAFNAATPYRVAYKHAHSQQNPDKDWGTATLHAIRFAFYVLNERFATPGRDGAKRVVYDPRNTLVIASGISNGAAAALQAAEQDLSGLIDGVAVTEPSVQPGKLKKLRIVQGAVEQTTIGRPLVDYFTFASLYQPCAALATASIVNLLIPANAEARCQSLADKGLVKGSDLAAWAADALARLRAYGWLPESDILHASHYALATPAIAVTYTNGESRASVLDDLCGFSFANTSAAGDPIAQDEAFVRRSFSYANGVPPTSGPAGLPGAVNLVYNDAANAAPGVVGKRDILASSPSTGRTDYALDGALCQRSLVEGFDAATGEALDGEIAEFSRRLQEGTSEAQVNARLRGKPTLIAHGRNDTLIPVNHTSRAYYGANHLAEGKGRRNVSYIEVTNAQHFDAFLPFPDYAARYVPLHVYLIRGLNHVYDHLTAGVALPPSQVVRTTPRGSAATSIAPANVPEISANPAAGDRITFSQGTLTVPD
jgi:hydroxybutyrate-dimer hydrolase